MGWRGEGFGGNGLPIIRRKGFGGFWISPTTRNELIYLRFVGMMISSFIVGHLNP
jgi:hypothetical protein